MRWHLLQSLYSTHISLLHYLQNHRFGFYFPIFFPVYWINLKQVCYNCMHLRMHLFGWNVIPPIFLGGLAQNVLTLKILREIINYSSGCGYFFFLLLAQVGFIPYFNFTLQLFILWGIQFLAIELNLSFILKFFIPFITRINYSGG